MQKYSYTVAKYDASICCCFIQISQIANHYSVCLSASPVTSSTDFALIVLLNDAVVVAVADLLLFFVAFVKFAASASGQWMNLCALSW